MKLERFKEKRKINKVIIIVFVLLLITGGFILGTTYSKYTYETDKIPFINGKVKYSGSANGDVTFAFYIDGKEETTMPKKDSGYVFDKENSNCDKNATITWDNSETRWGPYINNLNETKTKCSLYFKKPTDLVDMVVTSGDGVYKVVNTLKGWETPEYRFAGKNVDNYVRFNDEIWRIIGQVNVKTSEGSIEQRLKIVRQNGISGQKDFGFYAWDRSSGVTNNWLKSKLKDMLNSSYYNSITGECYLEKAGDTNTTLKTTCNFNGSGTQPKGLDNLARDMIDSDVTWSIGGWNTSSIITSAMYEKEKNTEWSASNDTTYHKGIGIISPTDYGYAVGGNVRETCLATNIGSYNGNSCKDNDWLFQKSNRRNLLLSRYTGDTESVYDVENTGGIFEQLWAPVPAEVWPTVYLKSSVQISGGEGTIEEPFTLN